MDEKLLTGTIIKLLQEKNIKTDKVHVQKYISFIASYLEIPFRFSIYRYGPFSRDLEQTLDIMCGWGDIEYKQGKDAMGYCVKPQTKLLGQSVTEKLSAIIDTFHGVLQPTSNFDKLELYGTLHYYMKRTKTKDAAIQWFKDAKYDKFADDKIEEAYSKLDNINVEVVSE